MTKELFWLIGSLLLVAWGMALMQLQTGSEHEFDKRAGEIGAALCGIGLSASMIAYIVLGAALWK